MTEELIKKDEIVESIEQKIASGKINPHTRWYFFVRTVFLILATVIGFCLAIYLGSFIFFISRVQQFGKLAGFGWPGFQKLLMSLPWVILVLVAVLIVGVEKLGSRLALVYRRPLLYSILFIVLVVALASELVESTAVHRTLLDVAQRNHVPMVGGIYRHFGRGSMADVLYAIVKDQAQTTWLVSTDDQPELKIMITPKTQFIPGEVIQIQDHVMILAHSEGPRVFAIGIRKIAPELVPDF